MERSLKQKIRPAPGIRPATGVMLAAALTFGFGGCKKKGSEHEPSKGPAAGPGARRAPRRGLRPGPSFKPARKISQVWKAGTERAYVIRKGKQEVGLSWGRYEGTVQVQGRTAHKFVCKTTLNLSKLGQSFMSEVKLHSVLIADDNGIPLRFTVKARPMGSGDLVFGKGKVKVTGTGRAMELDFKTPAPLLANNHPLHEELILSLMDLRPGAKLGLKVFSPSAAGVVDLSVEVSKGEQGALILKTSLGEKITWSRGRIQKSEVAMAGISYASEKRPMPAFVVGEHPPLKYVRPKGAKWKDHEVKVGGRDVLLAGTMSVPPGTGKHPAALFWSGSGAQNRHGFAGPLDVGTWEVLDHLAAAGFVVLRIDDRGTGGTPVGKQPKELGFWDLVNDARAALKFLIARKQVDPGKVFVVGHSEGAMVATILAAEQKQLAGVVLMAGPARNLMDVVRDQMENLYWKNLPKKEVAKQRVQFEELLKALKQGRRPDPKKIPSSEWQKRARTVKWITEHIKLDLKPYLRKIRCPVLIAQGGKDVQVHPVKDAGALDRELRKAGNRKVTLKIFANLDHLFKVEKGVSSLKSYMNRSRRVDRGFLSALTAWMKGHAGLK